MSRSTAQSPWDCSRTYERYSHTERRRIISAYKRGQSVASIAKRCKRGEWAITVVIARHFNCWKGMTGNHIRHNRSNIHRHHRNHRSKLSRSRALFPAYTKFAKAQQPKNVSRIIKSNIHANISKSALRNRRFEGKKEIVSASANDTANHLKKLLRGLDM